MPMPEPEPEPEPVPDPVPDPVEPPDPVPMPACDDLTRKMRGCAKRFTRRWSSSEVFDVVAAALLLVDEVEEE